MLPKIEENLKRWSAQHPPGKKPSVFLLCRYGLKLARGLSEDKLRDLSARWADQIELHEDGGDKDNEEEDNEEEGAVKRDQNKPQTLYMTMHKSKGLEADYVLILGSRTPIAMVKLLDRLTASDFQRFSAHDWISLRHEIQRQ